MDSKKDINRFINRLWQFIKADDIPAQNDEGAWDKVVDDATELTKNHQGSDPLDSLFRKWVVAYLQYMSDVSKGTPTLMQECKEVVKTV